MSDLSTIRDELRTYERQVGGQFILEPDENRFVASHWDRTGQVWVMASRDTDLLMRWVRLYVQDISSVRIAAE